MRPPRWPTTRMPDETARAAVSGYSISGLASVYVSTTWPSTASTRTSPRCDGGESAEKNQDVPDGPCPPPVETDGRRGVAHREFDRPVCHIQCLRIEYPKRPGREEMPTRDQQQQPDDEQQAPRQAGNHPDGDQRGRCQINEPGFAPPSGARKHVRADCGGVEIPRHAFGSGDLCRDLEAAALRLFAHRLTIPSAQPRSIARRCPEGSGIEQPATRLAHHRFDIVLAGILPDCLLGCLVAFDVDLR